MKIDPRNPKREDLVDKDPNPAHLNAFDTLVLLSIETKEDKIYFVVEGVGFFGERDLGEHEEYFYEEHTCPTNFIRIPLISYKGDRDPHGLFKFEDVVWMTSEYIEAEAECAGEDYLVEVFPQLQPTKTS